MTTETTMLRLCASLLATGTVTPAEQKHIAQRLAEVATRHESMSVMLDAIVEADWDREARSNIVRFEARA